MRKLGFECVDWCGENLMANARLLMDTRGISMFSGFESSHQCLIDECGIGLTVGDLH